MLLERLFTTNPFELPTKRQAFICPLTPSSIAQGERCAPAAFLRSVSNLSGPLSRIEPLSSVPVVTIACPLRCRLVDRSEARCKSRWGRAEPPRPETVRNPTRSFVTRSKRALLHDKASAVNSHASRPSAVTPPEHGLAVESRGTWSAGGYVLVLASELPGVSVLRPCPGVPRERPPGRARSRACLR